MLFRSCEVESSGLVGSMTLFNKPLKVNTRMVFECMNPVLGILVRSEPDLLSREFVYFVNNVPFIPLVFTPRSV